MSPILEKLDLPSCWPTLRSSSCRWKWLTPRPKALTASTSWHFQLLCDPDAGICKLLKTFCFMTCLILLMSKFVSLGWPVCCFACFPKDMLMMWCMGLTGVNFWVNLIPSLLVSNIKFTCWHGYHLQHHVSPGLTHLPPGWPASGLTRMSSSRQSQWHLWQMHQRLQTWLSGKWSRRTLMGWWLATI